MALADFDNETLNKLRGLLGTFSNDKVSSLVRKSTTYIESQYFEVTEKVTVTVQGQDDTYEYKAKEVLIDGTEVAIGVVFDSDATGTGKVDETIYLPNLKFPDKFTGDVEVGKIYQVDAVDSDTFGGQTQYYIIPKGGGVGAVLYCIFKSNEGGGIYKCDVYPNALFEQDTETKIDALVRVFNVDYGEVLNNTKLTCWEAPQTDINADYYAEAPTWQQEVV